MLPMPPYAIELCEKHEPLRDKFREVGQGFREVSMEGDTWFHRYWLFEIMEESK